jgi:hypothetical protein
MGFCPVGSARSGWYGFTLVMEKSPMPTNRAPVIIDVEASGFGRGSYPIEIGVALEDGDTLQYLIRPEPEWTHWETEAHALHGLDREHLLRSGQNVRVVARSLNTRLAQRTVYSNAWGHDSSWIALLYDAAGIAQAFRIEALESLVSEDLREAWLTARQQTLADLTAQPHRAHEDARMLQSIYLRMMDADLMPAVSRFAPRPGQLPARIH